MISLICHLSGTQTVPMRGSGSGARTQPAVLSLLYIYLDLGNHSEMCFLENHWQCREAGYSICKCVCLFPWDVMVTRIWLRATLVTRSDQTYRDCSEREGSVNLSSFYRHSRFTHRFIDPSPHCHVRSTHLTIL